ncbi:hypothetical protein [Amycolatopsis panacis]|uniref:Uncharacterized protein n=1 Tax=Amycolatopsis panacis TaxID=2340917 RepID=A0A419IAK2_9PSEU|nr:hypothetical protein [Amycolatopsis panacis]RJQ90655.1 hypothetical protein D5S19_02740 [Amycolatopsis panacis]
MTGQWKPRDDAELAAGWRLWLELGSCAWPGADWDGTPAEAVRGLDRCFAACDEILDGYHRGGGPGDAAAAGLVRSMILAANWTLELWRDDTVPLDAERAALLHADLAGFADHAASVRTILADGGGWASLPI